jgi:hypothetical protein
VPGREQHGSIVVPVGQDLPLFWMTKDKEFQSSVIIWDRMKDLVNFLLIREQILPPARNARAARLTGWPQQGARHNYCSAWLARHGDINKLVLQAGHETPPVM